MTPEELKDDIRVRSTSFLETVRDLLTKTIGFSEDVDLIQLIDEELKSREKENH